MNAEVTYKVTHEELSKVVSDMVIGSMEKSVYDKWYHMKIDFKLACEMHQVSYNTLKKYIETGNLSGTIPGSTKLRLSEVLKWDLSQFKYKHQ